MIYDVVLVMWYRVANKTTSLYYIEHSLQGGLSMVKIVLTSHFHREVRATIGLVPTSQLPWWCYIENERTIWERSSLTETPRL